MKFVSFETATEWCSVALWLDGEIVGLEERAGHGHSEKLLPMLDRLAAGAGIALGALDAVAFGAGPGAFTGLRIACGAAQGVALARGIPVIGISTLEAMAEESGAARVIACLDARMREVYYAAHERIDGGRWREVNAAPCVGPAAAVAPPRDRWFRCGDSIGSHGSI